MLRSLTTSKRFSPMAAMGGCVLTSIVFGCGGQSPDSVVPRTQLDASSFDWSACPDDLGGDAVECTQVEVPLNWDHPESHESTSVLLRRRTANGESRGVLWALDGGPGFAGDAFLEPIFADMVHAAGLDLYIPSHRGTIGESALYCPGAQAASSPGAGNVTPEEWPSCRRELEARWGDGLRPFTVRAGALDVAHAMKKVSSNKAQYVFGGSYGSLWAHRLLLDTDAQPDGMLLDSIVPIGATLERVDENADAVVAQILRSCEESTSCVSLFEDAPLERSRAAIRAYATGDGCGAEKGLTAVALQNKVHEMLNGSPGEWIKIVALYERLIRCTDDDVDALLSVLHASTGPSPSSAFGAQVHYNVLLNRHLLYRELYLFDRTENDRDEFEDSALASGSTTDSLIVESSAFGESYRVVDEPEHPRSSVPVTLLSGRLDPLDLPAWAERLGETLDRGNLVMLPWAGHSTLRYLGWDAEACGRGIFEAFLRGETADFSCGLDAEAPDLGRRHEPTQRMVSDWFMPPAG